MRWLDDKRKLIQYGSVGVIALTAIVTAATLATRESHTMVPLYPGSSYVDQGKMTTALAGSDISYIVTNRGIEVSQNEVNKAKMLIASKGADPVKHDGFGLMDKQKFGISSFHEGVNYHRALEDELAASIERIGGIQSARVHLAVPKPSVFISEKTKPTASVLLTGYGGRSITNEQAQAIAVMVANSIPNLSKDAVSVVNDNGELLGMSTEGSLDDIHKQRAYIHAIEDNYRNAIEKMLIPLYGINNVSAQVTADVDFSEKEAQKEEYAPNNDPAQQSIRSRQTNEGNGAKSDTVNYELNKTLTSIKYDRGVVTRLTAGIVVNAGVYKLTPQEAAKIEALVKESIGFSKDRTDSISVVNTAFGMAPDEPVEDKWIRILTHIDDSYVGVLGFCLLVLFLGYARKRWWPSVKGASPTVGDAQKHELIVPQSALSQAAQYEKVESDGRARQDYGEELDAIRTLVKENPQKTADIIKEWLKEEPGN